MPEARVELALRTALESEAELTEHDGADERLLTLLGLRGKRSIEPQKQQSEETSGQASTKLGEPGKRRPGRDSIGEMPETETANLPDEELAAG